MNRPELLAPAGNWEALAAVIAAGADAVYLGGKRLNMRQWRSDLNFSDSQLKEALDFAHRQGVKVYITVNNLYFEDELDELADHLEFLESIGADALIVQDLAVVQLAQEMGLTRPLHASVQVGLSNAEELELFKSLGFSRAIVSKDLSIEQIWGLSLKSDLELECFVHGDLCAAQTGQCLLSSLVFGESSNRGRCMKPCRWRYQAFAWPENSSRNNLTPAGSYLLACKDL
ncbi:MAG: peptidase U32 family protein, partial [Syntrophomonadaceae bacterium]|nr:peptidase U32 family protein [Syntrophomonadaceae bacterium]